MTLFTKRIAAGGDDGDSGTGAIRAAGTELGIGNVGGTALDQWLRFTVITIPQGSAIDDCKVTFRCDANTSANFCNNNIYFNDVDTAVNPVSEADYNGKAVTGAIDWSSIPAWTAGSDEDTPELKTILQTIISRVGWASGNALMVLVKDNTSSVSAFRRAETFDGDAPNAALLTINYTVPFTPKTGGII